ncbi:MAG TPA: phenylalanine--tRNA ligase subunit beta, partial [Bacillota bacterium]|nr:phenylalanine--tRNA ligase subunit beta [Bacillota bacterium]
MKVSLEWLRDYVDIDVPVKDYCDAMTMSGTKVESYEALGTDISNVVVGCVDKIDRHENSDHLFVCSIDVGTGTNVQIVTGAQNVSQGDLVPAALDGAVLPGGKTIKSGKLRGVASDGMLCSLSELGLTTHDFPYAIEDGIFILQEKCVPGEDIRKVCRLNDTVVDFELTFNRPDCLGFIGIARESAAALKKHLTLPKISEIKGKLDEKLLSAEIMNAAL